MERALLRCSETKLFGENTAAHELALKRLFDKREEQAERLRLIWSLLAMFGAVWLCDTWGPLLEETMIGWGWSWGGDACMVALIVLYAILLLSVGKLVPERCAATDPERAIRHGLSPLRTVLALFFPLHICVRALSKGLLRLLGTDIETKEEQITEESIRQLVDIGEEAGTIDATEKEMIENIFEFDDRSAEDVMTHRMDVTSIQVDSGLEDAVAVVRSSGLSRFPVYGEDIDDVLGVINARDLLLEAMAKEPRSIRQLVREAYFVPETVEASKLFRDMQKRKTHMAIVVDEYGGLSGVVTMEDLLEQIVGDIYDETDPQAEA